jgi:hypothetical protein
VIVPFDISVTLFWEDEMSEVIFVGDGLVVSKLDAKFYVKYDAGAHEVAMRDDEISEEDARRIVLIRTSRTSSSSDLRRPAFLACFA